MKHTMISIDLAKRVFQLHGVDDKGHAVMKKQLKRAQVLPFFANLTPCRVGMEACGSAHYWARKLQALPTHPNWVSSMDFVMEVPDDGRRLKVSTKDARKAM